MKNCPFCGEIPEVETHKMRKMPDAVKWSARIACGSEYDDHHAWIGAAARTKKLAIELAEKRWNESLRESSQEDS